MEELLKFIRYFNELDTETEQAIRNSFVKQVLKKGTLIAEEGKICSKAYFIESGLIRRFYLYEGLDITKWFYFTGQWVTSMSSFFEQKPSLEYLQVCEKTIVYSLTYEDDQKLLKYLPYMNFHIKQLRLYASLLNEFHHQFKLMNAQEKYAYMLKYFPEIIQKAKLKHIASIMDISQETLSRVRSSIF